MASVRGVAVFGVLALSSILVVASAPPAAAAVTITVDPSTGLADGQPITVTGEGFDPGVSVGAAECSAAIATSRNTNDCDLSNSPIVPADSNGRAVIHLRAKRVITTQNATIDCLTSNDPCVIGMADISNIADPEKSGGAQITFDPNAPPVPPPDVSFSPSGDLIDRQQVAVYATGFVPGEQVALFECAASKAAEIPCAQTFQYGGNFGIADPTGAVAVGIALRRALLVDGQRFDCASAVGACVIVARAAGGPAGTAPLTFDASVPLPPPPTFTATPATGLGDGEIVHVHGAGFTPNAPVAIVECLSGSSPQTNCFSPYGRSVQPDANGAFTSSVEVQRSVQQFDKGPAPTTTDCITVAGGCVLWAFDYADELDSASVPISFDPAKPGAPPPTADVTPNTGLSDGQTVSISGDGFAPGAGIFLVECRAGSTDQSGCDISHLSNVPSDDNGHVEGQFAVQRFLALVPVPGPPPPAVPLPPTTAPGGGQSPAAAAFFADDGSGPSTFDCASAPGACTLAAAFVGGAEIEAASVPLTFTADATTSTATTVVPVDQPVDAGTNPSTSTSEQPVVQDTTVARSALPRTGTDVRRKLRLDLVLLVAGSMALIFAAGLRSRAHRRALRR